MRVRSTVSRGMVWVLVSSLVLSPPASARRGTGQHAADRDAARQAVVIRLPFRLRLHESVRSGGHQIWRSDPRMAAVSELGAFVGCLSRDATVEAGIECRVIERGIDAAGRPTAVVWKRIPHGVWLFRRAVARIHLFENAGGVWIATRIVIAPQADESSRSLRLGPPVLPGNS